MKHSAPEDNQTPAHVPGLDVPAVLVEGAAIMIRGSTVRLAMCEGPQVRFVIAMQLIDAVAMAEQILAGRDEKLKQTMAASKGPTSSIHREN